jgi:hypothetical protein
LVDKVEPINLNWSEYLKYCQTGTGCFGLFFLAFPSQNELIPRCSKCRGTRANQSPAVPRTQFPRRPCTMAPSQPSIRLYGPCTRSTETAPCPSPLFREARPGRLSPPPLRPSFSPTAHASSKQQNPRALRSPSRPAPPEEPPRRRRRPRRAAKDFSWAPSNPTMIRDQDFRSFPTI